VSEYYWQKGEDAVEGHKDGDGHEDDVRDFVIDSEKEFDQADEEKADCRVQDDGDIFDHPVYMELCNAFVKERTSSDTPFWLV